MPASAGSLSSVRQLALRVCLLSLQGSEGRKGAAEAFHKQAA